MKITILTLGSRGDVQPCIAVGIGLLASGHEVRVAAPTRYENLVRERGLDFFPIQNGYRQIFRFEPGRNRLEEELNPIRLLYRKKEVVEPVINGIFSDLWSACEGMESVLYSPLALPVYYMAKDLGIPAFTTCLQPLGRSHTFPSIFFSRRLLNMGIANRMSHILVEQAAWQFFRSSFGCWRKKLGLSSLPFLGHFKQFYNQSNPVFNGYSPFVAPKPEDWGNRMHVTGYWFLDERSSHWTPSSALKDFIESGEPPVCIGFGSMNDNRVEERVKLSIEALRKAGKRGIFLSGQSDLKPEELPMSDKIFVAKEVPHSWLFPRVSAVIHHGGAGTTATAIRVGIPSIIIPFFFDQLFWGRRLASLGVGPQPITSQRLSAEALAVEIKNTVGNNTFLKRLQTLSVQVREEDGVKNVVNAFHYEMKQMKQAA